MTKDGAKATAYAKVLAEMGVESKSDLWHVRDVLHEVFPSETHANRFVVALRSPCGSRSGSDVATSDSSESERPYVFRRRCIGERPEDYRREHQAWLNDLPADVEVYSPHGGPSPDPYIGENVAGSDDGSGGRDDASGELDGMLPRGMDTGGRPTRTSLPTRPNVDVSAYLNARKLEGCVRCLLWVGGGGGGGGSGRGCACVCMCVWAPGGWYVRAWKRVTGHLFRTSVHAFLAGCRGGGDSVEDSRELSLAFNGAGSQRACGGPVRIRWMQGACTSSVCRVWKYVHVVLYACAPCASIVAFEIRVAYVGDRGYTGAAAAYLASRIRDCRQRCDRGMSMSGSGWICFWTLVLVYDGDVQVMGLKFSRRRSFLCLLFRRPARAQAAGLAIALSTSLVHTCLNQFL